MGAERASAAVAAEGVGARRGEDRREREARARADRLREFAEGAEVLPVLVHPDPDPDALAAAYAAQVLLRDRAGEVPIVTLGAIRRPENRRMSELLRLTVTEVRAEELYGFERVLLVDLQPRDVETDRLPRLAVVDHHPRMDGIRHAEVCDIRPDYGACSTMLTEYLRAVDPRRVGQTLATALLYGIKTDTDGLTRGVSPPDVLAYAFLQQRADLALVHRIERPMYSLMLMRRYGQALDGLALDNGLAAAYAGVLPPDEAHMLADLADFCLSVEGVSWVVVAALVGEELVLTVRHLGESPGAGALAERLASGVGQGGGHAAMGRATWPAAVARERLGLAEREATRTTLLRLARRSLDELLGG